MATASYWQRGESLDYTNGSGSKIGASRENCAQAPAYRECHRDRHTSAHLSVS